MAASVKATQTLTKKSISKASVKYTKSFAYNGKKHAPSFKVALAGKKLKKGRDFTVKFLNRAKKSISSSKIVDAGVYYAKISGKGSYRGSKTVKFKVTALSLSSAKVSINCPALENGKSVVPTVTVKLKSKKLVKGSDYTVTFKNQSGAAVSKIAKTGHYKACVTGKGNYRGSKTSSFEVIAKRVNETPMDDPNEDPVYSNAKYISCSYANPTLYETGGALKGQTSILSNDWTRLYIGDVWDDKACPVYRISKGGYTLDHFARDITSLTYIDMPSSVKKHYQALRDDMLEYAAQNGYTEDNFYCWPQSQWRGEFIDYVVRSNYDINVISEEVAKYSGDSVDSCKAQLEPIVPAIKDLAAKAALGKRMDDSGGKYNFIIGWNR